MVVCAFPHFSEYPTLKAQPEVALITPAAGAE